MTTPMPDFDAARDYAKTRLNHELPPHFIYHSLAHTENEVVWKVEQLAPLEAIAGRDLLLLRTAAWFHDIGFIEQSDGHETHSARIAREALPAFGYNARDLDAIAELIMATRLPQTPLDRAGQVLADADLDVLGRTDFLERNKALRAEVAATGKTFADQDWYRSQLKFLQTHHYFTASATRLNAAQKARNVAALSALLARAEAAPSCRRVAVDRLFSNSPTPPPRRRTSSRRPKNARGRTPSCNAG